MSAPDASLIAMLNWASKALIWPETVTGLVTRSPGCGWLTTVWADVAGLGLVWQTLAIGEGVALFATVAVGVTVGADVGGAVALADAVWVPVVVCVLLLSPLLQATPSVTSPTSAVSIRYLMTVSYTHLRAHETRHDL